MYTPQSKTYFVIYYFMEISNSSKNLLTLKRLSLSIFLKLSQRLLSYHRLFINQNDRFFMMIFWLYVITCEITLFPSAFFLL